MNLLQEIQAHTGVAYIFIAHDLSVVRHISDRVAVMYLGRIVEEGPADRLFNAPAHPYTCALLSAVPTRRRDRECVLLEKDIPDPRHPPGDCRFRTRRWKAQDICAREEPDLRERGQRTCARPVSTRTFRRTRRRCGSSSLDPRAPKQFWQSSNE